MGRSALDFFQAEEGMLLLELSVSILILAILTAVFYQSFFSSMRTFAAMEADLGLYRADRYTQSLLMKELSCNTKYAEVGSDITGKPILTIAHNLGNIRHTFVVRNQTLYRRLETGTSRATNPFSDPGILVRKISFARLSSQSLLLAWCLEDKKSGRRRDFRQIYFLANGQVVE